MKQKYMATQLFFITFMMLSLLTVLSYLLVYLVFPDFYMKWSENRIMQQASQTKESLQDGTLTFKDYRNAKKNIRNKYRGYITINSANKKPLDAFLFERIQWYKLHITVSDRSMILYTNELVTSPELLVKNNSLYIQAALINDHDGLIQLLFDFDSTRPSVIKNGFLTGTVLIEDIEKLENTNPLSSFIASPSLSDKNKTLLTNYMSYQQYKYDDKTPDFSYPISIMNITDFEGNAYKMTISVLPHNANEYFASLREFYGYLIILGLFIALIFALIYAIALAKPIKSMNRITKSMADLDFSKKVKITSNNELGQLGTSINKLSDRLSVTIENLERELRYKHQQETLKKLFIDNASHELKTPLSVIKCHMEMIEDHINVENHPAYFTLIQHEIEKMNHLILRMHDLSRYEELTPEELHLENFDLKKYAERFLLTLAPLSKEKDLQITFHGDHFYVRADVLKIQHALNNLLKNALENATPHTSIHIIGTKTKEDQVRIEISNACNHLSQEEIDGLWERFEKGINAYSQKGSGIGLSIVSAILHLHEANFGASPTKNGIIFYFELLPAHNINTKKPR